MSNCEEIKQTLNESTHSMISENVFLMPLNSKPPFNLKYNDSILGNNDGQNKNKYSLNHQEFIVKKVELVHELKKMLNIKRNIINKCLPTPTTPSSRVSALSEDNNIISDPNQIKKHMLNQKQNDPTSKQTKLKETEIDPLLYQAIHYIKVLEKNQLKKRKLFIKCLLIIFK